MTTFFELQITNFRIINFDCLNNDWMCTFVSIYYKHHQIQNVTYYFLCCSLNFCLFICYLLFSVFYLLVFFHCFLSNLFKTHRKNLGKAIYQASNISLSLAITIVAVVFKYSNQKSLTSCNFATFFSRFCAFSVTSVSLIGNLDNNYLGLQFQFFRSIFP